MASANYEIGFTQAEVDEVARTLKAEIAQQLQDDHADQLVVGTADLVSRKSRDSGLSDDLVADVGGVINHRIAESGAGDDLVEKGVVDIQDHVLKDEYAEDIMWDVGDEIIRLLQGPKADELVLAVADIVLDHLPGVRRMGVVRRIVKKVANKLLGRRADMVVEDVGDVIIEKIIEGGHSEELVEETLNIAAYKMIEEDESESLATSLVDTAVEEMIQQGEADALVDDTLDATGDRLVEREVSEDLVDETLELALRRMITEQLVEEVVEQMQAEYPAR